MEDKQTNIERQKFQMQKKGLEDISKSLEEQKEALNNTLSPIKKLSEILLGEAKGDDGHTPTDEELTELIKPLIPEVKDGHTPTEDELLVLIRPLIPVVKNGETPSDERLISLIKPLIPKAKEIDEEKIISKILSKIPKEKRESAKEIIQKIKESKTISYNDLKDQPDLIGLIRKYTKHLDGQGRMVTGVSSLTHLTDVDYSGLEQDKDGRFILGSGTGGGITVADIDGIPTVNNVTAIKFTNGAVTDNGDGTVNVSTSGSGGGGDVSSNTATAVDGEVALFSGTGGKTIKRATGSGLAKLTSGVLGTASAGTDYVAPNAAITGATKTKITYDAKGLVTTGTDATTTDITEGSNLYFTDERAQDAVGTILTDSSSIDFTYNDGANTISAAFINAAGYTTNTGTVTSTSVVTANGISGSVATATTTPAITLSLGAITPTSVTASGAVTGSNLSGTNTGDQLVFKTISVSGQSDVVADTGTDTLTLVAGTGMTITTNATTDTITLSSSGGGGGGSGTVNTGTAGYFGYYPSTGTTIDDQSVLYTDGTNVGIGTSSPQNKLHVYSTTAADGLSIDGNNFPSIVLRSSGIIKGYAPFITTLSGGFLTDSLTGDMGFRSESNRILFGVGASASTMQVSTSSVGITGSLLTTGNVGIGTSSPSQQLHVAGNARITGALYDSSNSAGTSGYVLSSTGTGTSWVATSGGSGTTVSKSITQTSHGFAVGDIVRLSGTSTYSKARADVASTADAVGIVSAVAGANDFTLVTHGYVTGLSGLTVNTTYFLSPTTAGALTTTEPTTSGQISKPVFEADTTSSGYFINYRGIEVGSGGGGGASGDMFAILVNTEVSITGTTTLTSGAFGKLHVCSGTSADYTVILPAVSGNTGKFIGFRMSSALTKLVTLDGNSSETIDGATTRVMWANETAILYCDGTTWTKVAGKSIPMGAGINANATQAIAATTFVTQTLPSVTFDNASLSDAANNKITIRRAGMYSLSNYTSLSISPASGRFIPLIAVNNTGIRATDFPISGGSDGIASIATTTLLTVGDYVTSQLYQDTGATRNTVYTPPLNLNSLVVQEILIW